MTQLLGPTLAQVSAHGSWRNVVEIGLGFKLMANGFTATPCLKFFVPEKHDQGDLAPQDRVPPAIELPGLGRILTDVEKIGLAEADQIYNGRYRPALGGHSLAHSNVRFGTLGCLVHKRDDPNAVFLLSNNHVIADCNDANIGDRILQPGPGDNGQHSNDVIAKLADCVRIDRSPNSYANQVDAAIAGPVTKKDCQPDIEVLGLPKSISQSLILPGMTVQKVGRTTGHKQSLVDTAPVPLQIHFPGKGTFSFRNLVRCHRHWKSVLYSDTGDSGALVLDEYGYALGLHVASDGKWAYFCQIIEVCNQLGVDLLTTPLI